MQPHEGGGTKGLLDPGAEGEAGRAQIFESPEKKPPPETPNSGLAY